MTGISDADGREHVIMSGDVIAGDPFSSKAAMERCHLEHFAAAVKHSSYAFSVVKALDVGQDPPDFEIARGDVIIGVEATIFDSFQLRKESSFFIEKIEPRFVSAYHFGRLRGLSGLGFVISVDEYGDEPRSIDTESLNELIGALEAVANRPFEIAKEDDPLWPAPYPLGVCGEVISKSKNHTFKWRIENQPLVNTALWKIAGFQIDWKYRAWEPVDDIQARLNKIVSEKDSKLGKMHVKFPQRPGNTDYELLISAGAPDQRGRRFRDEASRMRLILPKKWTGLNATPLHIRRVFVDIWESNIAYLIYDRDNPGPAKLI